ncbi:hypothetical protein AJ80_06911 [Polytolypa hystricis UAMH7299]|uniref:Uncharacterized protein n=1 Tax=Polytolypa hystricis (strain UAMH7299) TaxID=1447883 RepID=A0A2B7XRU1_POLH7|nr:hypothetical protein AJ80_06911 [Polytolypa hystricis UAMH7299]
MRHIIITSDNLDEFSRIFSNPRRQSQLESLLLDCSFIAPTDNESNQVHPGFESAVRRIFQELKTWQDDCASIGFARQRPLGLHISDKYGSEGVILKIQGEEPLVAIDIVSSFTVTTTNTVHPPSLFKIAKSLPSLDRLPYNIREPKKVPEGWEKIYRTLLADGLSNLLLPSLSALALSWMSRGERDDDMPNPDSSCSGYTTSSGWSTQPSDVPDS